MKLGILGGLWYRLQLVTVLSLHSLTSPKTPKTIGLHKRGRKKTTKLFGKECYEEAGEQRGYVSGVATQSGPRIR